MGEIKLTDLIDVDSLQSIQDGFSRFTGMAALTTDADGVPVTKGSGFTHFCMEMVRRTPLGSSRCEECDKQGAIRTLETGKTAVYTCHAGLVDFAAPIMLDGRLIGSFIGGQVRTEEVDEPLFREKARELGLDEEKYLEAAGVTQKLEQQAVEKAADFLSQIANILSEMTYNNYAIVQNTKRLERIARSQTDYIIKMNMDLQRYLKQWMSDAGQAVENGSMEEMKRVLGGLLSEGAGLVVSLDDTVEYIRMTEGALELKESEYRIRDLVRYLGENARKYAGDRNDEIIVSVDEDVPERLLGDEGRIGQIISKLLLNSLRFTENGKITLHVASRRVSYAIRLMITIADTGGGMNSERLERTRSSIDGQGKTEMDASDGSDLGLNLIGVLLRQMDGSAEVDSEEGRGTVFTICLPQLEVR